MIKTSASITVQYDSPFAPYPAAEWKSDFGTPDTDFQNPFE